MSATLIFASLIVIIASALTVLTGFGFVILSAPLLSLLFDPVPTVFLTVALGTLLLGILVAATNIRKSMNKKIILSLSVCSILGLPVGILILPTIGSSQFKFFLGVITLLFVLTRILKWQINIHNHNIGIALAGFLGGVFSTSTGMSAIPIVVLINSIKKNSYENRATLAGYIFLTGVFSLVTFQLSGALKFLDLHEFILLIPSIFLGMLLGIILIKALTEKQLDMVVSIYLVLIGILAMIPFDLFKL